MKTSPLPTLKKWKQFGIWLHLHRQRLGKSTLGGLLVGIVIAFSLPQTYTAEITFNPKTTWSARAISRKNMLQYIMNGESAISNPDADAFNPLHYRLITHSTPFLFNLSQIQVRTLNDTTLRTLTDYVNHDLRQPWWNYLLGLPGYTLSAAKRLISPAPLPPAIQTDNISATSLQNLSKKQRRTLKRIGRTIQHDMESEKRIAILRVTLQDPMVAALTAQAVVDHLQSYLQTYRDRKAQLNLAYCDSLFRQARREYYAAQEAEAAYRDTHRHLHGYTAREPQRRLALLRQEAYRNYVATEQSLREAQERVAAVTPLFTVITPTEVPLHPDGPARPWVVLVCTLLGAASLPLGSGIARRLRRLRYWKRRRPAHRSRPTNPASAPTATEPALNPTAR